jgi:hypothetical protein
MSLGLCRLARVWCVALFVGRTCHAAAASLLHSCYTDLPELIEIR